VALASDSVPTQRWLTDANLLAMLSGMSRLQTAAANLELQSWNSDTVRAFAASVAADHSAIQRSIDSVVTQIKVAPVMPALGQAVVEQMAARVDTIGWFRGPLLDRAYVRRQNLNLETMAQYAAQLAAAAERPEVQSVMSSASSRINAQLSRGKALQLSLAKADSMTAADSLAAREARKKRGARNRPASKPDTQAPRPDTLAPKPDPVAPMPDTLAPKPDPVAPKPDTIPPKPDTASRPPR
jgi:predicted outer membrane protein